MTEQAAVIDVTCELDEVLHREYQELSHRVVAHRRRAKMLADLAEQASRQAADDERLLNEVASVLGLACQLRIDNLDRRLRGQRLQEVAIEILAARIAPGEPVHYKQWFEWTREAGFDVAGKDPVANFLTQVTRSSRITSIGRRSGMYALASAEPASPDRAAARAV